MDRAVSPLMKVRDISLLILCWLSFSPLMSLPNRHYTYLSRKQLIWLIVFSPFVWTMVCGLFIFFGLPTIAEHFPSLVDSKLAFNNPEINLVVSSCTGLWQSLLVAYFTPVYVGCVGVLFLVMALTGWTYVEASVYICQLGEPVVCCVVALCLIVLMFKKVMNCKNIGRILIVIPINGEILLGIKAFVRFIENDAEFESLGVSVYFHRVVLELLQLGCQTGTNYIVANMIVYIFPILAILFLGYLAWIIWTLTRR